MRKLTKTGSGPRCIHCHRLLPCTFPRTQSSQEGPRTIVLTNQWDKTSRTNPQHLIEVRELGLWMYRENCQNKQRIQRPDTKRDDVWWKPSGFAKSMVCMMPPCLANLCYAGKFLSLQSSLDTPFFEHIFPKLRWKSTVSCVTRTILFWRGTRSVLACCMRLRVCGLDFCRAMLYTNGVRLLWLHARIARITKSSVQSPLCRSLACEKFATTKNANPWHAAMVLVSTAMPSGAVPHVPCPRGWKCAPSRIQHFWFTENIYTNLKRPSSSPPVCRQKMYGKLKGHRLRKNNFLDSRSDTTFPFLIRRLRCRTLGGLPSATGSGLGVLQMSSCPPAGWAHAVAWTASLLASHLYTAIPL